MSVLNVENKKDVERYQSFMEKHGCVSQDLRWGKVKSGWDTEAVYLEENGEITAAMSFQIRKIIGSYHLLYANRGPICDFNDIETVKKLVKEAEPIVKKYNGALLKMDPEIKKSDELKALYEKNGFKVIGDVEDKHDLIQPIYNMILDIDEDNIDELMKRFSSKTRYNIRVSFRKGVTTRWSRDVEDLKKFYELYTITGSRDEIACRPYSYFEDMLEAFKDNDVMRIYISELDGEALSAALCFHYNNKTWYMYGASSNNKRNTMPNYQMQYEMIRWAIENGSTLYDFGGVFELTKENGLFKFKEGFCRREQQTEYIGEVDKVYHKFIYFLFAKGVPFMKKMRKKLKK